MINWQKWLGLPHEFGVHPDSGTGADCVLMVWAVLDSVGVHHPPFDPLWLELGKEGQWQQLREIWKEGTAEIDEPQEYNVCLFENGPSGLGVGIVINRGALIVHHKRGVCWVPLRAMRKSEFRRFI